MILAIDLTPTHGGGQQVLIDFLRVLDTAGASAAALVARGGWIEKTLGARSTHVSVPAPSRGKGAMFWRGMRFAQYCWMLFRQRALLRSAESIVVNDPELFLPVALWASFLGRDTTLYLHMAYRGAAAKVVRVAAMQPSVNRLVCVSHFVRRHTEPFVPASARRKLVVIENALPGDVGESEGDVQPGSVFRIAIIGRLVRDKGQDVVCALSRQLPQSEFYLIGPEDNADKEFVESIRRNSGSNVRLVGYQTPVIDYLRENRIGIVLVPSRIPEACPLVPIEGVVAGCAVIVRDLGGLAEIAGNAGLTAVADERQFYQAIKALQLMDAGTLFSNVNEARRRALAHYHPRRFERDVISAFGLR